jgi:hypothetical protein
MDLYGRLEELQGMTRLLIDDVNRVKPTIGEGNGNPTDEHFTQRRYYVRAVYALVEAFAEQHRRLLVELAQHNFVTIAEDTLRRLREIRIVIQDGVEQERQQYLQLYEKIKLVYRTAGTSFGQPLNVTFGDQGYETFQDGMELRNRVTHPKSYRDLHIHEQDLQTANNASEWFKSLQNEFVRVARAHREEHRW